MERHSALTLRRARALARAIGAILGVVLGIFYAGFILTNSPEIAGNDHTVTAVILAGSAVVGAAALALAAPLLSLEPYLWLEQTLDQAPAGEIAGGLAGVVAGLVIAALVAVLLAPLPWHLGTTISLVLALALVTAGARAGTRRRQAFGSMFRGGLGITATSTAGGAPALDGQAVVVDTSALIDGRIVDVARAGFLPGRLLIAGFMLEELQRVADSGDPMRRARGRRGLSALEELRRRQDIVCEVVELDFPGVPEVDSRLIKLALARSAVLCTSDHNLNRIASIAGVRVLNLNDLANALKPILTAGDELSVAIAREGKELQQGVGYLDDGTMVVVENARNRLGDTVRATVTSVLQTSSGRMIFAVTEADAGAPVASAAAAAATPGRRPRVVPR